MPGEVVSAYGSDAELRLDAGVAVRMPALAALSPGERCHAVVRPEKLEIHRSGDGPGGRPGVEGTIESSLYLGTAIQVVVRLPDGTMMTVLVPNSDDARRHGLPGAGEAVRLAWADEHIHIVREAAGDAAPAEPATADVA